MPQLYGGLSEKWLIVWWFVECGGSARGGVKSDNLKNFWWGRVPVAERLVGATPGGGSTPAPATRHDDSTRIDGRPAAWSGCQLACCRGKLQGACPNHAAVRQGLVRV